MTVTDQAVVTDLPCVCGCGKWAHKQGRATCKECGCQRYEPAPDAEVVKLRLAMVEMTSRAHYAEQQLGLVRVELEEERAASRDKLTAAAEMTKKLARAAAENKRLAASATVLTSELAEAERQAKEAQNSAAEMRQQRDAANADRDEAREQAKAAADAAHRAGRQIADLEAALVEAHKGLRLSDAEHLHQRLSRAALVIGRWQNWRFCPLCQHIAPGDGPHGCGSLIPVDVIIARRPKEEQ